MALLIFHSSCIGYVLSLARMGFHGTFKLRPNAPCWELLSCSAHCDVIFCEAQVYYILMRPLNITSSSLLVP